ncbi:hypothetical protein BWR18_10020 [Tateyamaria omphalii]|uniref:Uncharacterized protein n=1 Tax=Tateyamaria omphalii TaxID=299262 RepID=A0A1P8MV95_9RHOB|nr:hypothetical protein BWR18_10020 [Tateyamaria omphalii]
MQPSFFEGQYLGAADLGAIVDYFRTAEARHALSSHSWGVAAGLQLVASEIGPGEFQVSVTPGVAIDGYGRLIVVTTPTEVPTDKLQGINTGPVQVWIRYDQTPIRGARPGFNTCDAEDAFERIEESFAIEVGQRPNVVDRQSGVSIAGAIVGDAREAANATDPDAPLHCDGSVPFQEFPIDDEDSIWLVPLGMVSWDAVTNSFRQPADDLLVAGRIFRRQFGTIAQDIFAANGLIRLRDRATPFDANISEACTARTEVPSDYTICDDVLSARELIWLEGDTRLTGDLRVFGKQVEFRDERGRDYVSNLAGGVAIEPIDPLLLERAANPKNGDDLRVLLGPATDGHNRFTIGPASVSGTTICDQTVTGQAHFVVQDDGKVGVGTAQVPDSDLVAPFTVRGLEGTTPVFDPETDSTTDEPIWHVFRIEDVGGAGQWEMALWLDGESLSFNKLGEEPGALYLDASGRVGIANTAPRAKLEVSDVPVGASSGLGDRMWMRVGDGGDEGDAGRFWIEYGEQSAPLVVISDQNDPPRMQFQQTGNGGDEFNPNHTTWIGHLTGGDNNFGIIGDGQIGLRTEDPYTDVTIDGTIGFKPGSDPLVFMFEANINNVDRMVLAHSPASPEWGLQYRDVGDRFVFQTGAGTPALSIDVNGREVGIGTDAPTEALDVRGNVKLGDTGEFFAVGTTPNMRMLGGEISPGGTVARGQGFSAVQVETGVYRITFNPAFAAAPFVTATTISDIDNLISVQNVSATQVTLRCYDTVDENGAPLGETDTRFMFIALGER